MKGTERHFLLFILTDIVLKSYKSALGFQSTQIFGFFFLMQLSIKFFFTSTFLMQLNRLLHDQQYEISCLISIFGLIAFLFIL